MSGSGEHFTQLARRSTVKALRDPTVVVPAIVFPLFFLALNAAGLEASAHIEGFPTDSYITFALGTTFVQAGMNAVISAGGSLAEDIRSGFLNRMALTRISGGSILVGHLVGTVALGFLGAGVYLLVGLAAGAHVEAGIGGALLLLPLSALIALAFGLVGVFAALRTGSAEAVQLAFPVLFVLFFLSSMALPRDLIETDWFRTVATYNPLSYLIEACRSLLVFGWDAEALALGVGIALVMVVSLMALSLGQMKNRMLRK